MNLSKKNDPRCWKKWAQAGAVAPGNAIVVNLGHGKRLVRFTKPTSVKDVVASMERAGWRPATLDELLGGSAADVTPSDAPFPDVPYLNFEDGKVELGIKPRDDQWGSSSRFLFRE